MAKVYFPNNRKKRTLIIGIVIRPDKKLANEMSAIIRKVYLKYKTYKAFEDRKGPHITLIYPQGRMGLRKIERITKNLKTRCKGIKPFTVNIDGIASFRKKYGNLVNYVVYFRVIKNKDLIRLYRMVGSETKEVEQQRFITFHPHISIARADIDKKTFYSILHDFRGFRFKRKLLAKSLDVGVRSQKRGAWEFEKLKFG